MAMDRRQGASHGGPMVGAPRLDLDCFSFSLSLVLGFACFLAGLIVGLRKRKAEEGHAPRFLGVSLAIVGGDSLASLLVVG